MIAMHRRRRRPARARRRISRSVRRFVSHVAAPAPARTPLRTSPRRAAACSGCSGCSDSYRSARSPPGSSCSAPWANLARASGTPKLRHRLSCATLPSAMKVVSLGRPAIAAIRIGAAIGFLAGQRLVLRRQAFDRVEDDRALEPQPVGRIGAILALGQPELEQGRVEQLAGIIAGERPPGAVGAMLAGREADDRQPGLADRRTPAPARSTSRDARRGTRAETRPAAGTAGNRAALRPGAAATGRRGWRNSIARLSLGGARAMQAEQRISTPSPSAPTAATSATAGPRAWSRRRSRGSMPTSTCSTPRRSSSTRQSAAPAATSPMRWRWSKATLEPPTMLARSRRSSATSAAARAGAGARGCSTSTSSPGTAAAVASRRLTIPHPRLAERDFVLGAARRDRARLADRRRPYRPPPRSRALASGGRAS